MSAQASLNTYRWAVPQGFPSPPIPGDNPISDAKVELGRYLFYDTGCPATGHNSCGTGHQQARASLMANRRVSARPAKSIRGDRSAWSTWRMRQR